MKTVSFPLLTVIVLLPAAGALLSALLPASREAAWAKPIGMIVSLAELGFVVYLVVDFPTGNPAFQFMSQHEWIGTFGINWKLGVDGISLFLVGITSLL